jgi:hypothetical protein
MIADSEPEIPRVPESGVRRWPVRMRQPKSHRGLMAVYGELVERCFVAGSVLIVLGFILARMGHAPIVKAKV